MRHAALAVLLCLSSASLSRAGYLYSFTSASDALPDVNSSGATVNLPFSFQYATPTLITTTTELSQSDLQNVSLPSGYHILVAAFEDPVNEGQYPFQPAMAFSFDQSPIIGGSQLNGFELENWSGSFSGPGLYKDNQGDTLSITNAPEPSAFTLSGAGMVLLAVIASKRNRVSTRRPPNDIH